MLFDEFFGHLTQGLCRRDRFFALLAFGQGCDGDLCLLQTGIQSSFGCLGMRQRAYHQLSLIPDDFFALIYGSQGLATLKAFGDLLQLPVSATAFDGCQALFTSPHRFQAAIQPLLGHLCQRERPQVVVAPCFQMRARLQRHHLAVPDI